MIRVQVADVGGCRSDRMRVHWINIVLTNAVIGSAVIKNKPQISGAACFSLGWITAPTLLFASLLAALAASYGRTIASQNDSVNIDSMVLAEIKKATKPPLPPIRTAST